MTEVSDPGLRQLGEEVLTSAAKLPQVISNVGGEDRACGLFEDLNTVGDPPPAHPIFRDHEVVSDAAERSELACELKLRVDDWSRDIGGGQDVEL